MPIARQDLTVAAFLSNAAYQDSDGLLATLTGSGWRVLGSDPVTGGPFASDPEARELPKPPSLPIIENWDSYFGEGFGDSNFLFDNGFTQALVARNELTGTLAISFRGTGDGGDGLLDNISNLINGRLLGFTDLYENFSYLIEPLNKYIADNGITRVLVTGHSLGGAIAELFMADHPRETGSSMSGSRSPHRVI